MGPEQRGMDVGEVSHHDRGKMPDGSVWDVTFSRSAAYTVTHGCDTV